MLVTLMAISDNQHSTLSKNVNLWSRWPLGWLAHLGERERQITILTKRAQTHLSIRLEKISHIPNQGMVLLSTRRRMNWRFYVDVKNKGIPVPVGVQWMSFHYHATEPNSSITFNTNGHFGQLEVPTVQDGPPFRPCIHTKITNGMN